MISNHINENHTIDNNVIVNNKGTNRNTINTSFQNEGVPTPETLKYILDGVLDDGDVMDDNELCDYLASNTLDTLEETPTEKILPGNCFAESDFVISDLYESIPKPTTKMTSKILNRPVEKILDEKEYDEDKDIVEALKNIVGDNTDSYNPNMSRNRGHNRWNYLIKYALKTYKISNIKGFLDFGGGEGYMAEVIGCEKLNLPKKRVHVADVAGWASRKYEPSKNITFHNMDSDGMKNIKTNSIGLITILHVMHHIPVEERDKCITELVRILSPQGLIILYEHDCSNQLFANLITLEHLLFDVVLANIMTLEEFKKDFYAAYMSESDWANKFIGAGLKQVGVKLLNNKDNSFYSYFKLT